MDKPIPEAVGVLRELRAPYACMAAGHEGEPAGEDFGRIVRGLDDAISALTAARQQQQAVADETVLVERHYAENIHYAALVLAQSKSPIDRREAAVLQGIATRMGKANTAPPPSAAVGVEGVACPECGSTDKVEDVNGVLVCGNHFCGSEPWKHPEYEALNRNTAPPPSVPVGVDGLVMKWRKESESLDIHPAGLAARRVCAIELENALKAQQPAPVAPVGVEGVHRYLAARDTKPIRGMDPEVIHTIHTGTEWEAELRVSDLRALAFARTLAQQPAAVDSAPDCPHSALDGCDCYAALEQESNDA